MTAEISRLAEASIPFLLIVDFEMKKPLLYPLGELPDHIRFSTPVYHSGVERSIAKSKYRKPAAGKNLRSSFEFISEPVPYPVYRRAFDIVRENALLGNTYLANLTFPSGIKTDLSLEDIFEISHAPYKLLVRDEFVVFSPETFIRIGDGMIHTFPMKGTIDADLPGARELLLGDEKERAEHVTIVDLLRNDMSIHATDVRVEDYRYIDTLTTSHKRLLQVSSRISGKLPPAYPSMLGEIIFSMLPAGSVSGAPKPETLRIIRKAENAERGYYTGIMGYFDGKDFDSAVLIRYIEKRGNRMIYRSGGGLTFMSDPEKEYREMIDKIYVPLA